MPKRPPANRAAGRLGSIGIELSIATVGGLLIGSWLDERWATKPWLTLIGVGLGMFTGFYAMMKSLSAYESETKDS